MRPTRAHRILTSRIGIIIAAVTGFGVGAADTNPMALLVRNFVIPEGHYRGVASFEGIPGGYERRS